ncbi:MAG: nuclear transport factor 2 family protein [Aurantibacter sp.]
MKTLINIKSVFGSLMMCLTVFSVSAIPIVEMDYHHPSESDQELFDTIVALDSIFFTAYNNCDLEKQSNLLSEDLEFYHDKGGLSTSKREVMTAIENNICGKVTRELVKGSIEVHEIPGFGAVQMGLHKFHNNQEPDAISRASKFITIWKRQDDAWEITRVISLH